VVSLAKHANPMLSAFAQTGSEKGKKGERAGKVEI